MPETFIKEAEKQEIVTDSNGIYASYIKRPMDFLLSFCAVVILSPILLILTIIGAIVMKGNPFFVQKRPGRIDPKTGKERIFNLIKFRTMTCERDEKGELLPDDRRITRYGNWLRKFSLDELPELINILKGDMSAIGPRPQLVRDMVFMSPRDRMRHMVRPGLSGLAQINGRNAISWESKFEYDLEYIQNITFLGDWKIIILTVFKVLRCEDINAEGKGSADDYGDYLLHNGFVEKEDYDRKQADALELLKV